MYRKSSIKLPPSNKQPPPPPFQGKRVIEDLRYSLKILMIFVFGLAVTLYTLSPPAFHFYTLKD